MTNMIFFCKKSTFLSQTQTSDVLTKSSNGSDDSKEEKTQYYPGSYFIHIVYY